MACCRLFFVLLCVAQVPAFAGSGNSLLDLSADEWEPFLGQRLHLPFAFLAPERARAVPSLALGATTPQGAIQHLWQVAP